MTRAPFDERPLLSREEFKRLVFLGSKGRCVFCTREAVDAHHVLDRKLFTDGGYYLDNGAALCEAHHWQAETTRLSVLEVRRAAGIRRPFLPPQLNAQAEYDKWGNQVWPTGLRTWGPLRQDTGARKALAAGGFLGQMMPPGYAES